MKCKNCGRELEPISKTDDCWTIWQHDWNEGMRYRHKDTPTKLCHSGVSGIIASVPESEWISQILSKYLD